MTQESVQLGIKKVGLGVIIFLVGVGYGGIGKTQTITKEVIKEVPVEKIVEVEKNSDTWRELKITDDKGFTASSEAMQLCSAGFYAISNSDIATLELVTKQMKTKTVEITEVAVKRQILLKELGY